MFFPFPCGAMRTAAAPAWPVCDCVCVIALCQGQGRAAGPRLSGASAHLGKFRLNSSTFLNTQLIETLTNSNPRARPQMGREPSQHSERERESCSRVEISHSTVLCYKFAINIYSFFSKRKIRCLSCKKSVNKIETGFRITYSIVYS